MIIKPERYAGDIVEKGITWRANGTSVNYAALTAWTPVSWSSGTLDPTSRPGLNHNGTEITIAEPGWWAAQIFIDWDLNGVTHAGYIMSVDVQRSDATNTNMISWDTGPRHVVPGIYHQNLNGEDTNFWYVPKLFTGTWRFAINIRRDQEVLSALNTNMQLSNRTYVHLIHFKI